MVPGRSAAPAGTTAPPARTRARLTAERGRIDAQIAALTRTRDRLDAIILFSGSPASGCRRIAGQDNAARANHAATP
ncbi:hypothetical protein MPTA5024_02805 [Microbispora sp. ATCC PTA-5024]|nr:hypothetical protein MPTA5024_02805 [Microbispora sp. ATCC PTA-5024]